MKVTVSEIGLKMRQTNDRIVRLHMSVGVNISVGVCVRKPLGYVFLLNLKSRHIQT